MKKNAYYFSHDTNASRDEKILAMRADYGWEGYGLFWAIIEAMAEATNYKLRFANGEPDNIDIAGLALSFRVSRKRLENFVESCIKKYKLFVFSKNKKYFYSKTLRRRLLMKNKKIDKLRVAGKKGAKKRWKNDSHPNGHPNGNKRKGNERKLNKSNDTSKLNFNYKTKRWENITEEDIKDWSIINPNCDLKIELEHMRQHLIGLQEGDKRRVKKYFRKFITGWIKRANKYITKPKISMEESLEEMEDEDG